MREPPNLDNQKIMAALRDQYDIPFTRLTFLSLGDDSHSAVYRLHGANGQTYLLKARAGAGFSQPSLAVPHYFHAQAVGHAQDVAHILAPLPTNSQALWFSVEDFALSLYPFIDGRTGTDAGLSKEQWRALGRTLQQIHADPLTPQLRKIVRRETFIPSRRNVIDDLETAVARNGFAHPVERKLAEFWRARQEKISRLVDGVDGMGLRLRQAPLPLVLCHADLHTWNILLDTTQQMWIIDWDEVVLAPKERDLMFVVDGIGHDLVHPHETRCFFGGYEETSINPLALLYYRYAWAVQDIAAYGERVFFSPHLGQDSRRDALYGFMSLFEPGNIVSIALASDNYDSHLM
jgi:spectinomycin phosphotransferase